MTGNTDGLKPSAKQLLERTFLRRSAPEALLSVELARHLALVTHTIGRQVGVLIDRRGLVSHVFVGDAKRIYLPDIGRQRVGMGHRRGLRHIHTVLGDVALSRDDLSDLRQLRLDCVAVLGVEPKGTPGALSYAFGSLARVPSSAGSAPDAQGLSGSVKSVFALSLDVREVLENLEAEASKVAQLKESDGRPRAMLIGVYTSKQKTVARMHELRELAHTAGLMVTEEVVQHRRALDSKYVMGRGKLEECVLACLDTRCDMLIIDHDLTPAQARAIAALSELKVLDRTQLILDIFAQHAKSRDGKLQVELAQLKYTLPRLTDLDAGLSRLAGGIGGRGPGETKLELGRRRARDRINRLERDISELRQQRGLRRQRRQHSGRLVVSIVGYTNAGKSTLMARLTQSEQLIADQLFATLDTTSRRLHLGEKTEVVLTDTVGFIRDLPADLMQAFRATLEELSEADLLLHVVDVADPDREEKMACVKEVLEDLELTQVPQLVVLNKVDTVEPFVAHALCQRLGAVGVSATQNLHMDHLRAELLRRLVPEAVAH